jgi:hypothetical protein
MGACGSHRPGGVGRTSQCSLESVGTLHCIPTQVYRRPYRCSVEVYRTVPNDYSVSVRWKVKTLHCSLPMCQRRIQWDWNKLVLDFCVERSEISSYYDVDTSFQDANILRGYTWSPTSFLDSVTAIFGHSLRYANGAGIV